MWAWMPAFAGMTGMGQTKGNWYNVVSPAQSQRPALSAYAPSIMSRILAASASGAKGLPITSIRGAS